MDLGYSLLPIEYYTLINSYNEDDIFFGDKGIIFIIIYSLDFMISMALLSLFTLYAKKSQGNEDKLKQFFVQSITTGDQQANVHSIKNESFLKALHVE